MLLSPSFFQKPITSSQEGWSTIAIHGSPWERIQVTLSESQCHANYINCIICVSHVLFASWSLATFHTCFLTSDMPKDNIFHSCETTYFFTLLLKLLPLFFSTLNPLSEIFWRPSQCIGSESHRVSGFLVNSGLVPPSSMTVLQPCYILGKQNQ